MTPAQRVSMIGIGIGLYVALSLALQMPFFENYYLCLGYIVLAVYCFLFGPTAGALVGTIGCILHSLAINGLRGMPGWALGNLFIGVFLGLFFQLTLHKKRSFSYLVITAAGMVLITAIGILGLKSLTEVILYGQPMWARVMKNFYAFIADSIMLILSIPFCIASESILGTGKKGN